MPAARTRSVLLPCVCKGTLQRGQLCAPSVLLPCARLCAGCTVPAQTQGSKRCGHVAAAPSALHVQRNCTAGREAGCRAKHAGSGARPVLAAATHNTHTQHSHNTIAVQQGTHDGRTAPRVCECVNGCACVCHVCARAISSLHVRKHKRGAPNLALGARNRGSKSSKHTKLDLTPHASPPLPKQGFKTHAAPVVCMYAMWVVGCMVCELEGYVRRQGEEGVRLMRRVCMHRCQRAVKHVGSLLKQSHGSRTRVHQWQYAGDMLSCMRTECCANAWA